MKIEEQFVGYEIALKVKELGFNEECFATYDENKTFELQDFVQNYDTFPSHMIAVPLYQQVLQWFREEHNINIEVPYLPNVSKYGIVVSKKDVIPKSLNKNENYKRAFLITDSFIKFDFYIEAINHAIVKAIELIKNSTTRASTTAM
jgi:hypothetical protein